MVLDFKMSITRINKSKGTVGENSFAYSHVIECFCVGVWFSKSKKQNG